jgi:hypothetical protein
MYYILIICEKCCFLHDNFRNLPSTKRHLSNSYCEPVIFLLYCRKLQHNRKADIVTKEYTREPHVFADAFNFLPYDGRHVIKPSELKELDTA